MNLLVISAAYPPMMAPEADHAYHLCKRLAERGLNVDVLTTAGNAPAETGRVRIRPVMRDWSWSDAPRLVSHVRQAAPDAVLLMYVDWIYNRHPMITFAPMIVKALLPNVTFVTQVEDPTAIEPANCSTVARVLRKAMTMWAGAGSVDYYFGTLLRGSDRIIVLSDTHRVKLEVHYPAVNGKTVLIPPPPILIIRPEDGGESRRQGREALGVGPEHFLFAYFGYIYPGKGLETLLRAFEQVAAKRPEARLAMIGGKIASSYGLGRSYAAEMLDLARSLGIAEKVRWTGAYPFDSDVASMYLRAADVGVFPLDTGVFLNNSSFGAAATHNLPLVVTGDAQGRPREPVLIHGENVCLCAAKSADALGGAMMTVLEDPELRERLRAGAARLAADWYRWPTAVDRTVAALASAPGAGAERNALTLGGEPPSAARPHDAVRDA